MLFLVCCCMLLSLLSCWLLLFLFLFLGGDGWGHGFFLPGPNRFYVSRRTGAFSRIWGPTTIQLFGGRCCLITRLPPEQSGGQPLVADLRKTHTNLAKPLGSSILVAKNQISLANFHMLDPVFKMCFAVARQSWGATLTVAW